MHGILFKYAQDVSLNKEGTRWLYGGSTRRDDLALKSTNHELTGLAHILDAYERATHKRGAKTETSRPVLRHALVALLDCQGVRLTAIALLPISKETLVYGSANGGEHVAARTDAHAVMLEVASELNLAPHRVADKELALYAVLSLHSLARSSCVFLAAAVISKCMRRASRSTCLILRACSPLLPQRLRSARRARTPSSMHCYAPNSCAALPLRSVQMPSLRGRHMIRAIPN